MTTMYEIYHVFNAKIGKGKVTSNYVEFYQNLLSEYASILDGYSGKQFNKVKKLFEKYETEYQRDDYIKKLAKFSKQYRIIIQTKEVFFEI